MPRFDTYFTIATVKHVFQLDACISFLLQVLYRDMFCSILIFIYEVQINTPFYRLIKIQLLPFITCMFHLMYMYYLPLLLQDIYNSFYRKQCHLNYSPIKVILIINIQLAQVQHLQHSSHSQQ